MAELPILDPESPGFREDPYPHYAQVRERNPVHLHPWGIWIVSGWKDCDRVLRDHQTFSSRSMNFGGLDDADATEEVINQGELEASEFNITTGTLPFMDPPEHTRVRRLASKAFTPRVVAQMRPWIERTVDETLDAADGDVIDVMSQVAGIVPMRVICEMTGIPAADHDYIRGVADDFVGGIDPAPSMDKLMATAAAAQNMAEYFMGHLERKRADPGDDLTSMLLQVREGQDELSNVEMVGFLVAMGSAGHETTASSIGLGILALLRNPTEMDKLRHDPSLIRAAVEELLRYDGPSQIVPAPRIATEEVELSGQTIRKGDVLRPLLGAANRDPEMFENPDVLDVTRENANRHLAFSVGIHTCLGAALARLEIEIVLQRLLERHPRVKLAEEPVWRSEIAIRGPKRLAIAVD